MSLRWESLSPAQRRGIRHGVILAGLIFAVFLFFVMAPRAATVGADAFAYWHVNPARPYELGEGVTGAFTYPPPAVWLFGLAGFVSWPTFWLLWLSGLVATLLWLGGRRTLMLLAFPPIALELYFGNVNLLIAAAIALGFRYPAAWAFVILTKVTPGIGLIWFAVRREWTALAVALAVTLVVVACSFLIDGSLWRDWVGSIVVGEGSRPDGFVPIPLLVRLPAAGLLIAWGGLNDRKWTVPVGATLALPVLWIGGLAILAALNALGRPGLQERRADRDAGAEPAGLPVAPAGEAATP